MDDFFALALLSDDADLLELFQMVGNGGLTDIGQTSQIIDTAVCSTQFVQYQHASGMGNGLQNLSTGFGLSSIHANKDIHIRLYVKPEMILQYD